MKSLLCCCHHNLWNSLLDHLRQAKLIDNFKSLLKLLFLSKLFMHEFYIQILCIFFNFLFNFYDIICVLFLSFGFLNGFFCIKAPLNLWILALYIKSFDIDITVIIPSHFNFLNHSSQLNRSQSVVSFLTRVTQEATKIKNKNIHVFLTLSLNKSLFIEAFVSIPL